MPKDIISANIRLFRFDRVFRLRRKSFCGVAFRETRNHQTETKKWVFAYTLMF